MLVQARYPWYTTSTPDWAKWRTTYEGGTDFINRYLRKMSRLETDEDFEERLATTYCPGFAGAVVDEIKNSIFQRMPDIKRVGGSDTYQKAIKGKLQGVDLDGSNMNFFIGTEVLLELLIMSKVGVLVDTFDDLGVTLHDKGDKHPYLGVYPVESILCASWKIVDSQKVLNSVLLREVVTEEDDYGLQSSEVEQFRFMKLVEDGVLVEFRDGSDNVKRSTVLNLQRIPFHIADVRYSLLRNVADYQIALLNLESCDINYAIRGNFPFYYEFFDKKTENQFAKSFNPDGSAIEPSKTESNNREVKVGPVKGRRFPDGLNAPGYVSPDVATLRVSMEKGAQLKDDIRRIVNLNLEKIGAQKESAESKKEGQRGLETSLSYIGNVLQKLEAGIAASWEEFESFGKTATISYPTSYSLKSDADRQEEVEQLTKQRDVVPSITYRREICKKVARIVLEREVPEEIILKIEKEIDSAVTTLTSVDEVVAAHVEGLIDDKTACGTFCANPEAIIEQAKKDNVEKLKAVALAQGGDQDAARGGLGGGADSNDEKKGKEQRGEGKKVSKGE